MCFLSLLFGFPGLTDLVVLFALQYDFKAHTEAELLKELTMQVRKVSVLVGFLCRIQTAID